MKPLASPRKNDSFSTGTATRIPANERQHSSMVTTWWPIISLMVANHRYDKTTRRGFIRPGRLSLRENSFKTIPATNRKHDFQLPGFQIGGAPSWKWAVEGL
jgi:hypothetical protein